jgi:hypothetical protein
LNFIIATPVFVYLLTKIQFKRSQFFAISTAAFCCAIIVLVFFRGMKMLYLSNGLLVSF